MYLIVFDCTVEKIGVGMIGPIVYIGLRAWFGDAY